MRSRYNSRARSFRVPRKAVSFSSERAKFPGGLILFDGHAFSYLSCECSGGNKSRWHVRALPGFFFAGVRSRPSVNGFDVFPALCSAEQVGTNQLQESLKSLAEAIRQTEAVLESMRSEHDPLALHIFISRRQYRNMPDTKSGKRREVAARLSWQTACELGFRGPLEEWERLMGAVSKR